MVLIDMGVGQDLTRAVESARQGAFDRKYRSKILLSWVWTCRGPPAATDLIFMADGRVCD